MGDLMQSISEKGILEPLLVRPVDGRYELIVGSRRFEAAKRLGMKKVPAIVKAMADEDALIVSLVENIQRRDVEPEEEYDALMKLKKLNPALYSTDGPARKGDRQVAAVRRGPRSRSPDRQDHPEGDEEVDHRRQAVPDKGGEEGRRPADQARRVPAQGRGGPAVQRLPEEKRAKKLSALAETIAELPRPEAQKVVERFVRAPQRPMEEIKRETETLRASKLEIVLDPRVADGLRRAAEERKTTMEAIASLAIHSWLRQNKYD